MAAEGKAGKYGLSSVSGSPWTSLDEVLVPGTGIEPARSCLRGIFLLATAFAAELRFAVKPELIWSLDFLFAVSGRLCLYGAASELGRGRQVSTLFRQCFALRGVAGLSSGLQACRESCLVVRPCIAAWGCFPEFDPIRSAVSELSAQIVFKSLASTNFATQAAGASDCKAVRSFVTAL